MVISNHRCISWYITYRDKNGSYFVIWKISISHTTSMYVDYINMYVRIFWMCTIHVCMIVRIVKKFGLLHFQVSLKERQASERYYMKRYAQDWINSSKCDEDKASFTTEHPRFSELIKSKFYHCQFITTACASRVGSNIYITLGKVYIISTNKFWQ